MNATEPCLRKRLQYILHWGFVEARILALDGRSEQIAELADAMEILPQYLDECDEDGLEMIRFVLQNYQSKFPLSNYSYLDILEGRKEPPQWN